MKSGGFSSDIESFLALNLDKLGNHELLVLLEPSLKVLEVSVAFVSFELLSCEASFIKRFVMLTLVALELDLSTLGLQMSDDLVISHCERIIITLAEASVLP